MSDQNAATVLKKLVQLADKADSSDTAIAMPDVFDNTKLTNEWLEAWSMARALIAKNP